MGNDTSLSSPLRPGRTRHLSAVAVSGLLLTTLAALLGCSPGDADTAGSRQPTAAPVDPSQDAESTPTLATEPSGPMREIKRGDYPFSVQSIEGRFTPEVGGESAEQGSTFLVVGVRVRSLLEDRDIPAPSVNNWTLQTPDCSPRCLNGFAFTSDYVAPDTPLDQYPEPPDFTSEAMIPPGSGYNVYLHVEVPEDLDPATLWIRIPVSGDMSEKFASMPRLPLGNLFGVEPKVLEETPVAMVRTWKGQISAQGKSFQVRLRLDNGSTGRRIGTLKVANLTSQDGPCTGALTLTDGISEQISVKPDGKLSSCFSTITLKLVGSDDLRLRAALVTGVGMSGRLHAN